MIDQTRIYNYQQRSIARDKSRQRAARLRRFILSAGAIAFIAAIVFAVLSTITPAHGETICTPDTVPSCRVSDAPYIETHEIFLPVVMEAR